MSENHKEIFHIFKEKQVKNNNLQEKKKKKIPFFIF